MIELIVAFSLLATVLSLAASLVVRHDRLLTSHRHYRLALDELSNQLDRLTALSDTERTAALEQLSPSPFAQARLPGVELQYELRPLDIGERLTLRVLWDEPQRRAAPVSMAAWIHPAPRRSDDQATEDRS